MIQEVITNITSAENQAEEIVRDATARAKEIRLKAESEADVILKQAAKDSKDATRLRQNNAEVAAQRKTEMIAREGNKEISDKMRRERRRRGRNRKRKTFHKIWQSLI